MAGIMSLQESLQVPELIRNLNRLAVELELLVEPSRTKPGSPLGSERVPGEEQQKEGGSPYSRSSGTPYSTGGEDTRGADHQFTKNKILNTPVRLNIGGKVFPATWQMLRLLPEARLAKIAASKNLEDALRLCDGYSYVRNEFYFHVRSQNFDDIYELYRSGNLHIHADSCISGFLEDLDYWQLPHSLLQSCCLKKVTDFQQQQEWDEEGAAAAPELELFPPGSRGLIQKKVWDLFEKPHTSVGARIIGLISLLCIIVSTVVLTLNTLPYFEDEDKQIIGDYWVFAFIEMVYMTWFTVEFIIRFVVCPSKVQFFTKAMNWIDILAIVPYYVTIILYLIELTDQSVDGNAENATDVRRIAQFFRLGRIVKTLRIIRIFKLARHSTGLQALGLTVKSNYKELGLLILFLGMGAIMFSSLVYVFENDIGGTSFRTMLDAYWWALITMTTVGYGDVVPTSFAGKMVGCACAVFGVLVIGLPIPIIGSSFNSFYSREKRREKMIQEQAEKVERVKIMEPSNQEPFMDSTSYRNSGIISVKDI